VWPPFEDVSTPAPPPVATAPAPPSAEPEPADEAPWVEPVDGSCPDGFPVKVKLSSGIAHAPGSAMYDRTTPDRCYVSTAAAESDGFRLAKR
jgi:hypothetical protein